MGGLKDRFLDKLQREIHKQVLTKNLRTNEYTCIIPDKNNPHFVVFIYNDDASKQWNFRFNDFRDGFSSQLISVFVNKDENDDLKYHVIGIEELLDSISVTPRDFMKNKDNTYIFNDEDNEYLDNWDILK